MPPGSSVPGPRSLSPLVTTHHYDNGYKVYDTNGAQIVPPIDTDVAAKIANVSAANDVPRLTKKFRGKLAIPVPDEHFPRYLADMARYEPQMPLVLISVSSTRRCTVSVECFRDRGARSVRSSGLSPGSGPVRTGRPFPDGVVSEPEEPGALDLASELAAEIDADLIIANDPDTDRLAMSVERSDGWRPLTGNQIGVLLADYVLANTTVAKPLVLNSIVSSPMLGRIAAAPQRRLCHNAHRIQVDMERSSRHCRQLARVHLCLASRKHSAIRLGPPSGTRTESQQQWSLPTWQQRVLLGANRSSTISPVSMTRLDCGFLRRRASSDPAARERPRSRPRWSGSRRTRQWRAAGVAVVATTDYRFGAENRPRYMAATPLVELDLGERGRALVRPSGTEPKLKIYVDLVADRDPDQSAESQELSLVAEANAVAASIADQLGL